MQSVSRLTQDISQIDERLSPEAEAEIRSLSKTLQDTHLQHRRLSNFAFEPVSLPASRVSNQESLQLPSLVHVVHVDLTLRISILEISVMSMSAFRVHNVVQLISRVSVSHLILGACEITFTFKL